MKLFSNYTDMKFSIIVPAHNTQKTINACLASIFNSAFRDFEVIVVDDASADATAELASKSKFPVKLVRLDKNSGAAAARNIGAENAQYEILVFIDSDVVLQKDTLTKIVKSFDDYANIAAVVATLSQANPYKNFFSQYKNLYMCFVLDSCPAYIDFIYGSCYAVKKKYLELSYEKYNFGQDTELGARLEKKGLKILLNKEIEVAHLKPHTFLSFVRNDFNMSCMWAKIFLEHKKWKELPRRRRVFHARGAQLLSVIIGPLIAAGFIFYPLGGVLAAVLFLILNGNFFVYLFNKRGFVFMVTSALVTWLDMLVMACGIITGFVSYLRHKLFYSMHLSV